MKRTTTEEFIEKAKLKRTDINFDYSKVLYVNNKTKVIIIDPKYGEFEITPSNFLSGGGHRKRYLNRLRSNTDKFIKRAKLRRTDINFDYSKVSYINSHIKILMIDPKYGEFSICPNDFLKGRGHHKRAGRDFRFNYISGIYDNGVLIALKYGVETEIYTRTKTQNNKSKFEIIRIKTWKSQDYISCINAERGCKFEFSNEQHKTGISKDDMRDGWTETTLPCNYDEIVKIYEKHGAQEVI